MAHFLVAELVGSEYAQELDAAQYLVEVVEVAVGQSFIVCQQSRVDGPQLFGLTWYQVAQHRECFRFQLLWCLVCHSR